MLNPNRLVHQVLDLQMLEVQLADAARTIPVYLAGVDGL